VSRFALRSLFARRRRAALTAVAVLLGVSMIAGTFVFTDTIHAAFHRTFGGATSGAAVIVSSRQGSSLAASAPATMPVSLVERIRRLPGVSAAQGQVIDLATIVGRDGKPIRQLGAQTLALSYLPPPFEGFTFVRGSRPASSNEVVIDQGTAEREHYSVGELVPIVTGEPVRRFRISGIARFSGASAAGSPFALFDLGTARGLYDKEGRVDQIDVAASNGTAAAALVKEIAPLLSPELVARTAQAQVDTDANRVDDQLSVLTGGLLAFGLIAVFVGAFVIFNTFSITVTQRMREFALLRALGATRVQVLRSVVIEAAAVGAVGAAAGLFGGLLAALGIRAAFDALGFALPSAGLVLEPRTVAIALAVGVLVTVAAGLLPALRATRAAPLEALRESALPQARRGWRRWAKGVPFVVVGIAGLLLAFVTGGSTSDRLAASTIGAVMLLIAIAVLIPATIRPLSRIVSWPLERDGRTIPRLARENATRNPTRTALSASALMIGLALMLFVTVYAGGLRRSTSRIIARTVVGDFTIQNQDGVSSIPAASARAAAAAPGVLAISSVKSATARIGSSGELSAEGFDPSTITQVYRFDWARGSPATIADLAAGDVLVEADTARDAHLHVGEPTTVTTETGVRRRVTVRGIYHDRALLAGFGLPLSTFDSVFHQERLQDVFVRLAPGASPAAATAGLNQALREFPGVVARSRQQLRNKLSSRVNSVLVLFYALLAMTVVMALLGIVNTLTLSIHERTRELGMLRAVGMTPGQARTLIRIECMITAAIGTLVGIAAGLLLAWIVSRALSDEGIVFVVPWLQVGVLLVVGLLVGVVAALAPSARAARVDVLSAIAQE
jgi:putative ABC transport system permease protein